MRGENAENCLVWLFLIINIRWDEELEKDEQSALLGDPPLPRRTLRRMERQVNDIISTIKIYVVIATIYGHQLS